MPPSTSSWSSVRSSTTLGLREPAATRETPRQQPSRSSSGARLQEGWWRRGPPGARGRSRMADRAPGGRPPGRCVGMAEGQEAEGSQEKKVVPWRPQAGVRRFLPRRNHVNPAGAEHVVWSRGRPRRGGAAERKDCRREPPGGESGSGRSWRRMPPSAGSWLPSGSVSA